MADSAPETKVNDTKGVDGSAHHAAAPIETGAWTAGASAHGDTATKSVPDQFPQGVHIAGNTDGRDVSPPASGREAARAAAEATLPKFDAVKEAADLNDALHPAFFSWRTGPDGDRVWNKLLNMSPQEFKAVNDQFTKAFGKADQPWLSRAKTWTLKDDVDLHLGSSDRERLDLLMESKTHNDVPPEHRVSGEELLKPGSNLKVGEINPVTMADGRRYDVYIPKNADNRAPVIVAMHGAAGGDSVGLMATESGLTADAERTGSTVIFAYPKAQKFDSKFGKQDGVAWYAPDRTNLPVAGSNGIDDYKYLDNVIADIGSKAHTAEKVGLFGFSDGGRFAEAYAADHPDRVAGVVSEDGTWMQGDKRPTSGVPVMIVHGDSDKTLPYNGGTGSVSGAMDWLLGTHLDKSAPYMQAQVWKAADQCDGPVKTSEHGEVSEREFTGCKVGEVKEYIVHGGQHGINDYKNDGSRLIQWLLGSADRRLDFSTQGAKFLTDHIVSDPSMDAPVPRSTYQPG